MSATLPRILIIDDLFGRALPDHPNEDRANLCGHYLIEDVTGDETDKDTSLKIKRPIAQAVFYRGQKPVRSTVGDMVENDLEGTLKVIRDGWFVEGDRQCWAMVLLDLCFYTGEVTGESNRKTPGMPEGRKGDDNPESYFGLRILQVIQEEMPDLPVLILSSKPRDKVSLEFAKLGAKGFIPREQGDPDLLKDFLQRHGLIPDSQGIIVGNSKSILLALRDARQYARTEQPLLLRGETGTGKELFARYIHNVSERKHSPLYVVSLPAIPTTLVEDTLFGHVPGAFNDAKKPRAGAFETADSGTLFLDEIGDAPFDVQAKLLRAIQFGEVQRLGSDKVISVDVRLISATCVDIESQVASGLGFRRDLLARLRFGGTLVLPPLREHKEDIQVLAESFVRMAERENANAMRREIDVAAIEKLCEYNWPENIRELESVIRDAVNRYPDVEHLVPIHIRVPLEEAQVTVNPVKDSVQQLQSEANSDARPTAAVAHTKESGPSDIDELVRVLDSFNFAAVPAEKIVGQLPALEGAFAKLIMRYLRKALETNVQKRTKENPRGEVRIQPTINMITGLEMTTSKAADILKKLLRIDEKAIQPLMLDPEFEIVSEAREKAEALRPGKRDAFASKEPEG